NVLLKHPLKKPDRVSAVLSDQPILRGIPGEDLETELFAELPRSLDILDSQADRKRVKFHALLLSVRKRLPPNAAVHLRQPHINSLELPRIVTAAAGKCCRLLGGRPRQCVAHANERELQTGCNYGISQRPYTRNNSQLDPTPQYLGDWVVEDLSELRSS